MVGGHCRWWRVAKYINSLSLERSIVFLLLYVYQATTVISYFAY